MYNVHRTEFKKPAHPNPDDWMDPHPMTALPPGVATTDKFETLQDDVKSIFGGLGKTSLRLEILRQRGIVTHNIQSTKLSVIGPKSARSLFLDGIFCNFQRNIYVPTENYLHESYWINPKAVDDFYSRTFRLPVSSKRTILGKDIILAQEYNVPYEIAHALRAEGRQDLLPTYNEIESSVTTQKTVSEADTEKLSIDLSGPGSSFTIGTLPDEQTRSSQSDDEHSSVTEDVVIIKVVSRPRRVVTRSSAKLTRSGKRY
jgi:hypothetical protein